MKDEHETPIAVVPSPGMTQEEFVAMGKVPWEKRYQKVLEAYPSVGSFDWKDGLSKDLDLFGRVMREILKLEQAPFGRPGPRPSLEQSAKRKALQVMGEDFSFESFPVAVKALAPEMTIRDLSEYVGLNKSTVHRLMTGVIQPDGYYLRVFAAAFDKHPSYFMEWRTLYIVGSMVRRLEWNPELALDLFKEMDRQSRRTDGWAR